MARIRYGTHCVPHILVMARISAMAYMGGATHQLCRIYGVLVVVQWSGIGRPLLPPADLMSLPGCDSRPGMHQ